jgi:hypothetical protein
MALGRCVARLPNALGVAIPPATATYARDPRSRRPNRMIEPADTSTADLKSIRRSSTVTSKTAPVTAIVLASSN